MSELIDRIPGQESLLAKMRGVVDTTAQLKARQRITGRSGQLGYAVSSTDDWDYVGTIPVSSSTYTSADFLVTFTRSGKQKFPIVLPNFDVRINGTSESNRMTVNVYGGGYQYTDSQISDMTASDYGKPVASFFSDEAQSAWLISLFYIGSSSGTASVYIKTRAQASSDGTFSVARIA